MCNCNYYRGLDSSEVFACHSLLNMSSHKRLKSYFMNKCLFNSEASFSSFLIF